ncbi:MAG: hypothetical protein GXY07_20405 [Candidatus Hydrogenedentes bacterium]|nr:hypothetical protein [Candidatus Hydrogenedentota bacterium]
MNAPINMATLVGELASRPRGRACIVLTRDFAGQKAWAAALARRTGAAHLDVLERFAEDASLAEQLSRFTPAALFDFLKEATDKSVLIVSGLEFLKASWSGQSQALEEFAAKVELWAEKNAPALLFVMQQDAYIAGRPFTRFRQHTFVVEQEETLALE